MADGQESSVSAGRDPHRRRYTLFLVIFPLVVLAFAAISITVVVMGSSR
ncbi:MAG: hypothetical protein Q8M17_04605 [Actinomycetota bacterium]|nr:hypothetical protein [Actinomycetota bacterium]